MGRCSWAPIVQGVHLHALCIPLLCLLLAMCPPSPVRYLADGSQEWYPSPGGRVGVFVEAAHVLHRWAAMCDSLQTLPTWHIHMDQW
jgi:hypothetical protein